MPQAPGTWVDLVSLYREGTETGEPVSARQVIFYHRYNQTLLLEYNNDWPLSPITEALLVSPI